MSPFVSGIINAILLNTYNVSVTGKLNRAKIRAIEPKATDIPQRVMVFEFFKIVFSLLKLKIDIQKIYH